MAQRLEVFGTEGTVVIEDGQIVHRAVSDEQSGQSAATDTGVGAAADPADLGVSAHAAQIADLLEAIDTGREPAITGADGRAALEIVCAVYESARSGRPVAFPDSVAAP
jgi:UDP-N-acetyl-2-amino-2-deoxyglucuronate dehydrogenase